MDDTEFIATVRHYSLALLNALTADERKMVADEIADDPQLASAILMLLSETVFPLLPEPQEGLVQ